jgi:hypothetical protein
MVKKLKVPPEKVREVKKRLLSNTLTKDDYTVLLTILDESIELGLVKIVPPEEDHD